MTVTKFKICGDIHGHIEQLQGSQYYFTEPVGMIVLGDFGANYFGNKKDAAFKNAANNMNIEWYAVKGNHEARPSNIKDMRLEYDENVGGEVYTEPAFPHIHYFKEYGIYTINGHKCAIIGGAYSVDKYYRLANHWTWHADEQLSAEEKDDCFNMIKGEKVDFIFSHTSPYRYRPTEMFLSVIDQSTVDNSMEYFLDDIVDAVDWKYYFFGHYHGNKMINDKVFMLYTKVVDMEKVFAGKKYRL